MLVQSFGDNRHFYPRSPCGERLGFNYFYIIKITISIHALLAESDPHLINCTSIGRPFLSTLSLRRATAVSKYMMKYINKFLSTLSLRRATSHEYAKKYRPSISIHALLAESDAVTTLGVGSVSNFYPRSPCGERRPNGKRTSVLH